jgi:hypothetical protein
MMSHILAWLIVLILNLTGIGMAESNDETEPRTVVRAMMTAYLDQNVKSFSQHVVPSVEDYDGDARFGVQGFDPVQLRHAFASGFKPAVQIRQVHTRVFGKTASVTVEMDGSLTEIPDKTRPGPWRLTQLWRKKTGKWQLTRYHGFPLLPRRINAQEALKQAMAALERFRDAKVVKPRATYIMMAMTRL